MNNNNELKKFPPCYNIYIDGEIKIQSLDIIISDISHCIKEIENIRYENNLILREKGYINPEDLKYEKPTFFFHIKDISCDIYTGLILYYLIKKMTQDFKTVINYNGDIRLPALIATLFGEERYAKKDTNFIIDDISSYINECDSEKKNIEKERIQSVLKQILYSCLYNKDKIQEILYNKNKLYISSKSAKDIGFIKEII